LIGPKAAEENLANLDDLTVPEAAKEKLEVRLMIYQHLWQREKN
jgi:hypothetical protein